MSDGSNKELEKLTVPPTSASKQLLSENKGKHHCLSETNVGALQLNSDEPFLGDIVSNKYLLGKV